MNLAWAGATDVGRVRQGNEDAFLAEQTVFVVADGMGGHNAGEVASELAVTTLRYALRDPITSTEQLRELVQTANTTIYTASLDDSTQRGMGTTVTALVIIPNVNDRVLVANVGDSRTYILRNDVLTRITTDHSYVQELVNEGVISAEDARRHPQKNIVTRALGIDRHVAVDVFSHDVQPGDRFLLCSDGLVDEVTDTQIASVLSAQTSPTEAARELVATANDLGGRDNITVVIVDVLPVGAEATSDVQSSPGITTSDEAMSVVSVTTAADSADSSDFPPPQMPPKKRHTFAYALTAAFLVFALLTTVTIVGVYARSGYFVSTDKDSVITVYRGRAGGIWWFQPTVEVQSELKLADIPPGSNVVRDVLANRSFSSLADAQQYLVLVETAVTTTTTTVPPATDDPLSSSTTVG